MTREQILAETLEILNGVVQDWEFGGTVGANTRLFADLALESLDLVVLGSKLQEHFGQTFPFPKFFSEMGQREVHDSTIGEWVDFIEYHLRSRAAAASSAVIASESL